MVFELCENRKRIYVGQTCFFLQILVFASLHLTMVIDFYRRDKMEKMDQHHISYMTQYPHHKAFVHISENYCILCNFEFIFTKIHKKHVGLKFL
jgi:hypothetical protein